MIRLDIDYKDISKKYNEIVGISPKESGFINNQKQLDDMADIPGSEIYGIKSTRMLTFDDLSDFFIRGRISGAKAELIFKNKWEESSKILKPYTKLFEKSPTMGKKYKDVHDILKYHGAKEYYVFDRRELGQPVPSKIAVQFNSDLLAIYDFDGKKYIYAYNIPENSKGRLFKFVESSQVLRPNAKLFRESTTHFRDGDSRTSIEKNRQLVVELLTNKGYESLETTKLKPVGLSISFGKDKDSNDGWVEIKDWVKVMTFIPGKYMRNPTVVTSVEELGKHIPYADTL